MYGGRAKNVAARVDGAHSSLSAVELNSTHATWSDGPSATKNGGRQSSTKLRLFCGVVGLRGGKQGSNRAAYSSREVISRLISGFDVPLDGSAGGHLRASKKYEAARFFGYALVELKGEP